MGAAVLREYAKYLAHSLALIFVLELNTLGDRPLRQPYRPGELETQTQVQAGVALACTSCLLLWK